MIEIERCQKNDRNNTNRTFILIHTLKVLINESAYPLRARKRLVSQFSGKVLRY